MCKRDFSLLHAYLTLSICLFFYLPNCHILLISPLLFVCLLFHVLWWLTWPSVACLLSCLSLNIARQSAEPWASKSSKVMLTPLTHDHVSSLLHPPKPAHRTVPLTHIHTMCISMVQLRAAECGWRPPTRRFTFRWCFAATKQTSLQTYVQHFQSFGVWSKSFT